MCLRTYGVIHKEGHAKGCMYALRGRIDPHAMHINNGGNGGGFIGGVGRLFGPWR